MRPQVLSVEEGATGILELSDGRKKQHYFPYCDMDAARELLLEFQELSDSYGTPLKLNYQADGHNWYPTMISQLYWYLFFPWVKYQPLLLEFLEGKRIFRFNNNGSFQGVLSLLQESSQPTLQAGWRLLIHDLLWHIHNRVVTGRSRWDLVFFRFAFDDFRSKQILQELRNKGPRFLEAVPAQGSIHTLRSIVQKSNHYFYAQPPRRHLGNRFRKTYSLKLSDSAKAALFAAGIQLVERTITSCLREKAAHQANFRRAGIRLFYGFDDVNSYIFPLLFAARSLGLPTIGHQHGAYVKRHAGYIMEGIGRQDLEWFDKVIVWGPYWKEKMIREAQAHPPERWILGSNKLSITFPEPSGGNTQRPPSSVLIPYEFLADTASIGKYIQRLIELGYTVWFRPRKDDSLERQLDAYQLDPKAREILKIADGPLDNGFLERIDIVAGTMTTLLYELLPAEKIIWYLETPYRHLYDLVEEGLAHHIRLEDLRPPGQMPAQFLQPTRANPREIFGSKPLQQTLNEEIISRLQ